jgi:hypothetical protein
MKNTILGVVGVLWGGAIIVYSLMNDMSSASGAYESGRVTGLALGVLLLATGGWTLAKRLRA